MRFPFRWSRIIVAAAGSLLGSGLASAAPGGEAAKLIAHLKMEKIPVEGPWFTLTYRSTDVLPTGSLPERYHGVPHVAGSAIYCLETREDFSAMHLIQTDEIWHYYGGSPLEMLLLYPDGHGETVVIGPEVRKGQHPQFVVPRGVWQGSRPIDPGAEAYTLFGDTLAPGFEYPDNVFGYRDELQRAYPKHAALIAELTREDHAKRPPAPPEAATAAKPAEPLAFAPADVPVINAGTGVALRELIGLEAKAKTPTYSVALFTLTDGHGTPMSYNKVSEESFLVLSGRGEVVLDGETVSVAAGSTVIVKPKVRHTIKAAPGATLTFYAVSAPAYSPDDFVLSPDGP